MDLPTYAAGIVQTKAYNVLREHVYTVLAQYDLTPTYWSMLGIIMQARDGVRQAEIARELRVKPPLVTIMARELQRRGLITIVPHQFDGRVKLLTVTPAGKRYVKTVDITLAKALSRLFSGLTAKDLATYHKVLTVIIKNDLDLET